MGTTPGNSIVFLGTDPLGSLLFSDNTPTTPGTGIINDFLVLPVGFTSGSPVSINFTEPNTVLSDFGLTVGDFFGTSFVNSQGETETITFTVAVPEPSSLLGIVALSLVGIVQRRRKTLPPCTA